MKLRHNRRGIEILFCDIDVDKIIIVLREENNESSIV
jgi:hypothetical protein